MAEQVGFWNSPKLFNKYKKYNMKVETAFDWMLRL